MSDKPHTRSCIRRFPAVGAVLGFALVWDGSNSIVWSDPTPDSFPYFKGLVPVIISWFTSPLIAGALAAFNFWMNR